MKSIMFYVWISFYFKFFEKTKSASTPGSNQISHANRLELHTKKKEEEKFAVCFDVKMKNKTKWNKWEI